MSLRPRVRVTLELRGATSPETSGFIRNFLSPAPTAPAVGTEKAKLTDDEDRSAGAMFSCVFSVFRIDFRNAKAATFFTIETSYPAQRGVGRA